ncbi:beta-lactamase-like protein [Dipodascopsis tothii]|uniref:beta-lactamase-like protein n=1 Tax=Dipodascopsis tothii TaxID=44089 RepID=UPI0034CD06B0
MDLPGGVAVDAFRYGGVPNISKYFLTHFHSDHYGGLYSSWKHGPIYCSEVTGRLVMKKLQVDPQYVQMLPMNKRIDIDGQFAVTLIDANHCPGSVLFLFESVRTTILHTGDFRACPTQVASAPLRGRRIDTLYLDTTYLNPRYTFPYQSDVVGSCAELCHRINQSHRAGEQLLAGPSAGQRKLFEPVGKQPGAGRLLVVVGTYSIGKERLAVAIARRLGTKIFASSNKRVIFECLQDAELNALLTTDSASSQVHLVSLREVNFETLGNYLDKYSSFDRVVAFRPTGWNFRPGSLKKTLSVPDVVATETPYDVETIRPARGSTPRTMCFDVPYSEHSSFRDLTCFCLALNVSRIIPTVNVGSEKSRAMMNLWINRWAVERRRGLLVPELGPRWHMVDSK